MGSFNIAFSNPPPFGKDIKIIGESKLEQYELNTKEEGVVSTLFLERNLQLLSDGGVLAIILPETYFHAPAGKKVRDFIYRHNIQWVIDIPHNTFRPHNNAKCIRWWSQTISDTDHNGNPIYNENKNIKDDTLLILDELNEKRKNIILLK